jgi:hypothetical protein
MSKYTRRRWISTTALAGLAITTIERSSAATLTTDAIQYHVAITGSDSNPGTRQAPFRTIQHAAEVSQPGDTITVHAGVYRERIDPPRGGTSEVKRITYQAAPGEKVIITGSELIKGWRKVVHDTWKVTIPNRYFGTFNPYADLIHGDWFEPNGRLHHTGCVYLNGHWLSEAAHLKEVFEPAGNTPLWFAIVNGVAEKQKSEEQFSDQPPRWFARMSGPYLLNLAWFRVGATTVNASQFVEKRGTQLAACSEGGQCVGFIHNNDSLLYTAVNFGNGTTSVEFCAAAAPGTGGNIELHLDNADGKLLGVCAVPVTGGWQKWRTFTAKITPLRGVKNLCLVFKPSPPSRSTTDDTVIYAQFPGVNPNQAEVEINVRRTVFTPRKTGINYLTVRGFDMRHGATQWAPPTAGQIGIVSAYWCKGWIIENNKISYSRCCGIALGKYSDEYDNTAADSADGYVDTILRALANGWNKATVGSHLVRYNQISNCGQTGIVGSMGCAFSTITGNDIHDIHVHQSFGGAEMAGIKFHGAIDVVISHNHIYRCGQVAGIWLDWMGQGAQVMDNLMHDNTQDMFFEMQHGPILVANNLLLSSHAVSLNSQGIAFAQNLMTGSIANDRGDTRVTPFQKCHSTAIAGMYPASQGDSGDDRFYNNLLVGPCSLKVMDNTALRCFASGNVFTQGAQASAFDTRALVVADFNMAIKLTEKPDGWYLTIAEDLSWRRAVKRQLVTTVLLGRAKISHCAYENPDGSPLTLRTDYFGKSYDKTNPFPGPFEISSGGIHIFKVWPVELPLASTP